MAEYGKKISLNCGKKMKIDVAQKERGSFDSPANRGKANVRPRSNENSFKGGTGAGIPARTEENAFQHGKRAKTGKNWRSGK